ncbi:DUF4339 domain-containing protein [Verrucomicrobiaceae bacterium 5K15]|uniref:DUF4339 domain-containing protein n=1 Tax=Oceaniferula flava TaxID=2800421 RepID=A0AAE2VD65_9BACT|nr:GYF domain-containing protein [Oceaniferula flavus]MBK1854189.1 DUF4339 domain-containing protein [Oceaniferula flavus]MBM1135495.1 DUF4339 domain-containing protein [Oceaniferula flavus]
MQVTDPWYYTDRNGAQAGPVSTAELQQMITSGRLLNTSMVWKQGMADWTVHSQIAELQPSPQAAPVEQTESVNPYHPPASMPSPADAPSPYQPEELKEYGGIRRLNYFMRNLLLMVAIVVLAVLTYARRTEPSPIILLGALVIFLFFYLRFAILRIRNIGISGWWLLLFLVPLVNNLLNIALIACPQGFADHKKMDAAGIVLAVIFGGFFLLSLAINIFSVIA